MCFAVMAQFLVHLYKKWVVHVAVAVSLFPFKYSFFEELSKYKALKRI